MIKTATQLKAKVRNLSGGNSSKAQTLIRNYMMERFLERLDARPCVASSNRNVFTALWTDESGRRMLFVLNPYSGAQRTRLHVFEGGGAALDEMALRPMEVRAVAL